MPALVMVSITLLCRDTKITMGGDHHDHRRRHGRAVARVGVGRSDLGHRLGQGLELLVVHDIGGQAVPQVDELEDDDRDDRRLDAGEHDAEEHPMLVGTVDLRSLQHAVGQLGDKLAHQEQTQGHADAGQQVCQIGVKDVQLGDDDEGGHEGHLVDEEQTQHNHAENQVPAGKVMLGQRVGSHAGYQHMQSRTQHRDEQRVEQITGQRHPHVRQDAEHLAVVVHHRTAHIERGRETEDLLNGLQGLNDRVICLLYTSDAADEL